MVNKMAGVEQRLKLKQTPIDTWSLKEQLALASAVLSSGDQNWVSVSRTMKQFGESGRPLDWFSQKNCALQYNLILEKADLPRRKRGEKNDSKDSPAQAILGKLGQERLKQLKDIVATERDEILKLEKQTELLNSDDITEEELDAIMKEVEAEEEEEDRKEAERLRWLQERDQKKLAIETALKTVTYRKLKPQTSTGSGASPTATASGSGRSISVSLSTTITTPTSAGSSSSSSTTNCRQTSVDGRTGAQEEEGYEDDTEPDLDDSCPEMEVDGSEADTPPIQPANRASSPTPDAESQPPSKPTDSSSSSESTKAGETKEKAIDTQTAEQIRKQEKLDEYDFRDEDAEITPIEPKLQVKQEYGAGSESRRFLDSTRNKEPLNAPTIKSEVTNEVKKEASDDSEEVKQEIITDVDEELDDHLINDAEEITGEEEGEDDAFMTDSDALSKDVSKKDNPSDEKGDQEEATKETPEDKTADSTEDEKSTEKQTKDLPEAKDPEEEDSRSSLGAGDSNSGKEPGVASQPDSKASGDADKECEDQEEEKTNSTQESNTGGDDDDAERDELLAKTTTSRASRSSFSSITPSRRVGRPRNKSRTSESSSQQTTPSVSKSGPTSRSSSPVTARRQASSRPTSPVSSSTANRRLGGSRPTSPVGGASAASKLTPRSRRTSPAAEVTAGSGSENLPPPAAAIGRSPAGAGLLSLASMRSRSRESESSTDSSAGIVGTRALSIRRSNRPTNLQNQKGLDPESGPNSPAVSVGKRDESPGGRLSMDDDERERHKSWKKSILMVWGQIAQHKHASLFANPVSEAEAPEYKDMVYLPVDLGNVKKSVESGIVRTTEEFQRDLNLMFLNATMYNSTEHPVYSLTVAMWKDAEKTIKEYLHTQALLKASERELTKTLRGNSIEGTSTPRSRSASGTGASVPTTPTPMLTDRTRTEEKRKRNSTSSDTGASTPTTATPALKKRRLRNADD